MKSVFIVVCIFSSSLIYAQELKELDLMAICQGKSNQDSSAEDPLKKTMKVASLKDKNIVIMDKGFCAQYLQTQTEILTEDVVSEMSKGFSPLPVSTCARDINPPLLDQSVQKDKWKIRFYASHSFMTYFNTDISFRSSRYNVDVKDYAWAERGSREFFTYEEWKKPGSNIFQMIDEPTNTFTVSIEKNGNEFFLSAFHPKYLQEVDQVKYMKGEIDGVAVDGFAPINRPFDGYNQAPGEMELVRNQNTHLQMNYEVGYGHRFNLMDNKFGKISYVPSIGLGVMAGQNVSIVIKKDQWWEFDDYEDPNKIQGFGGSVGNRLEYNTRNERVGVFYENKFGYYHMDHGFLDGSQKYDLKYMGNNIGVKFMIYDPNNKKKSTPKANE